jgi:hypothetical protein
MQKSLAFVFKKAISQGTDLRLRFVDGTIRSKYRVDEGEGTTSSCLGMDTVELND